MVQTALDNGIVSIGNLYRFEKMFDKIKSGKIVKIAFLGGSITQDCHTTVHELCYAYRTFDWFKRQFPSGKFEYINAGIGGTTSQFGVARVEDDILCHKPDMVFVEFSVNDSNTDKFKETYESLLRKILLTENEPAVFTFNNVQYDDGVNAQDVHNEVARYYKLPIVSMKDSIYQEILFGKYTSLDISTDNLHPNNVGHGLLAEVICNLLNTILVQYLNGNLAEDSYIVPELTLTNNRYISSKRIRNEIAVSESFISENVIVDTSEQYGVRDCFKKGFILNTEDSYFEVTLEFSALSVQYLKTMGKNSPLAALYIDGEKVSLLDGNFDENWDCLYLHDICDYQKSEKHRVRIEIQNYPDDCKQDFYFVSFITR